MDEKFDSDLNFSKILFLHINRTLISIAAINLFILNIEGLAVLLFPYFDDIYEKELAEKSNILSYYHSLDSMYKDKDSIIQQKTMELAMNKFRALMSLAERKGLLLEKTDRDEVWELEEGEKDATDNSMEK